MKPARTRFAPSPTGYLHVGGVRTALFAWLVARQSGGQFILRLEDTDKAREVEGSGQHITNSLRWLDLQWDEGLEIGGPHGPYKQSERLASYKQWAEKLVAKGRAYADPYTAEQLAGFRAAAKTAKKPFVFREHRPANPPEWNGSQPLRFKSEPKAYHWHDVVMGDLQSGAESIDDFILIKSDGYPTYNFAHIIDDLLMECTHIIRAQEFLASTPKFLNLYEALEIEPPILATVPPVMAPDGKRKLSKRDGAKDVLDYAKEGYLPEALINFMASLGWNDGSEQEVFSVAELIKKFRLRRVQRAGAQFDERRLLWMNGAHIRLLPLEELSDKVKVFWPAEAAKATGQYRQQVLGLIQERLKTFSELAELTRFFFKDQPVNLQLIERHKELSSLPKDELKGLLQTVRDDLSESDFSLDNLNHRLNQLLTKTQTTPRVLFSLIRIATTEVPASPALAATLELLGKDTSLRRIDVLLHSL